MSSTSRFILRHSEWNRLRRIVNSHALRFVPRSKRSMLARARTRVSCTRSSARSKFPVREIAKARNDGTAPSIASRSSGSTIAFRSLREVAIEIAQQLEEAVGDRSLFQVVVHRAQLRADVVLNAPVEAWLLARFRPALRDF